MSDVFLSIPERERAGVCRPANIYIHDLCEDTGCSLEDVRGMMDDWED